MMLVCVLVCVLVCACTDRVELQFVVQLDQLIHCVLLQDDDVGVCVLVCVGMCDVGVCVLVCVMVCVCWCVMLVCACTDRVELQFVVQLDQLIHCVLLQDDDVGVCWCVCVGVCVLVCVMLVCVLVCACTDRVELQFVVQLDQLIHCVLLQDDDVGVCDVGVCDGVCVLVCDVGVCVY